MFDTIIAVDWSARASPSPVTPVKDAIFLCIFRLSEGESRHPEYYRTRFSAMDRIREILEAELKVGRRTLIGFDFNLFVRALSWQCWYVNRVFDDVPLCPLPLAAWWRVISLAVPLGGSWPCPLVFCKLTSPFFVAHAALKCAWGAQTR